MSFCNMALALWRRAENESTGPFASMTLQCIGMRVAEPMNKSELSCPLCADLGQTMRHQHFGTHAEASASERMQIRALIADGGKLS
jgi:hypothetical protein